MNKILEVNSRMSAVGRDDVRQRITPTDPIRHFFWLSLVFGILFAALSFTPGFITGTGPFWDLPSADVTTSEIGWFYYAYDSWRFPLFLTQNYNMPEGSSVVLSDSIPLVALPAKVLYKVFWPAGAPAPIYMGLWVFMCFVLQAVVASRLLLVLNVRKFLPHLCGIALFCYMPMLFRRFGHMALLAHFLILLSIEAYVRAKRRGLSGKQWFYVCALPTIALLTQPYIAAMCGGLVAAIILDQWYERQYRIAGMLGRFLLVAIFAAVVISVGGMLSAATANYGDYGYYSANLLSPFVPFGDSLTGRLIGLAAEPSLPKSGQYEGAAWIGAGVAFLCIMALPVLRFWKIGIKRHWILFATLILMLAFAASNRVGVGSYELLNIHLPAPVIQILSTFRTSARFIWVAVYALLAGVIAAIFYLYRAHTAVTLMVIAAVLQIADVRPMQAGLRPVTNNAAVSSINREVWTRLISAHKRLYEFPSFSCDGLFDQGIPGSRLRELEINWIAARQNKSTNSAYLARPRKDCTREQLTAASHYNQPGTLYLYRSSEDIGAFLVQHGINMDHCGYLDDVVVCSRDMDLSSLH